MQSESAREGVERKRERKREKERKGGGGKEGER
jgi:hypothetical protein